MRVRRLAVASAAALWASTIVFVSAPAIAAATPVPATPVPVSLVPVDAPAAAASVLTTTGHPGSRIVDNPDGSRTQVFHDPRVDGSQGTASAIEPGSTAVATGPGYHISPIAGKLAPSYTVRFDGSVPAPVRDEIELARSVSATLTGRTIGYGPTMTDSLGPQEIGVMVSALSDCQGDNWAACTSTQSFDNEIYRALIVIHPDTVSQWYEQGAVLHEFGHAMGLDHFNETYDGSLQLMNFQVNFGINTYKTGDRNGLMAVGIGQLPDDPPPVLTLSNPVGQLTAATAGVGSVAVSGWAIDPDTYAPITVRVFVDGAFRADVVADANRPGVAQAYPPWGALHGFDVNLPNITGGTHQVCVTALNTAEGNDTALGCRTVVVPTGAPIGSVDLAAGLPDGTIRLTGWAIDPDTANPIQVHVYVAGTGRALTANTARPDLTTPFPGYGANHGYDTTITGLPPGPQQLCAYAINVGTGLNATLGCRTVMIPTGAPIGSVDSVVPAAGKVTAAGWAIDPDTAGTVSVNVTVDDVPHQTTAGIGRPDIAAAFAGYGANHGFSLEVTGLLPGSHRVCVTAINVGGPGAVELMTCRWVTTT